MEIESMLCHMIPIRTTVFCQQGSFLSPAGEDGGGTLEVILETPPPLVAYFFISKRIHRITFHFELLTISTANHQKHLSTSECQTS